MKRFCITFFLCSFVSVLAFSQMLDFSQTGRATQVMRANVLGIAHPMLPLYSQMMVENLSTGAAVTVTVIGRIPPSSARIADLSPQVWETLSITHDTDIRIFSPPPAPVVAPPPPPPVVVQEATPVAEEPRPVFVDPDFLARLLAVEARQDALEALLLTPPVPAMPPEPQVADPAPELAAAEYVPAMPPELFVEPISPLLYYYTYYAYASLAYITYPLLGPIPPHYVFPHVIPNLPYPASDRLYRLQVGAFSSPASAVMLARNMANAGFAVVHEPHGGMYRVIALGVPAAMVNSAIYRLASLGITQVWVKP